MADTILVDPSVLINAGVEPPPPAPAPPAPRQQQQQHQQHQQFARPAGSPSSPGSSPNSSAPPSALSSRDDASARRASTSASLPSSLSSSSPSGSRHEAQPPVLERLAAVAAAAGVPLGPLLEITAFGEHAGSSSQGSGRGEDAWRDGLLRRRRGQELVEAEELRARVDALCGVLRLPGAEAAGEVLRRHPRLLGLGAEELRARAARLERLVRGEAEGQQQAGSVEAEGEVDVGAMARGRPELLLQVGAKHGCGSGSPCGGSYRTALGVCDPHAWSHGFGCHCASLFKADLAGLGDVLAGPTSSRSGVHPAFPRAPCFLYRVTPFVMAPHLPAGCPS